MSEGPNDPGNGSGDDSGGEELPEQMRVRRAKLDRLRESGIDPYPVTVPRTTTLAAVRAAQPDLTVHGLRLAFERHQAGGSPAGRR